MFATILSQAIPHSQSSMCTLNLDPPCANTMHTAPDIHEHFMIYNRLRNIVYNFMHNLDNPEATVTNYVNALTHTDVITAHH